MSETRRLDEAVAALRAQVTTSAVLGLVLGSGLRRFGTHVQDPIEIGFASIPHWPAPKVEGHGGSLIVGHVHGLPVACLTGRVHLYEGWSAAEVVRPLRTLCRMGTSRFLLTNAAGGIRAGFAAGDLMVVRDHINHTGTSALLGAHEPALGPRFPDQSAVYSSPLRALLHEIDGDLKEGVYLGNLGPAYETPAEIRMSAAAGADAVGMSTVLEAQALAAMGAEVAAVSLISNLAAGISPTPLSHDEVLAAGKQAEGRLVRLVGGLCRRLAETA